MKKALIISGNQVQDQEFIYPYYRLLEEKFTVDVCINENKFVTGILGTSIPPNKDQKLVDINDLQSSDYDFLVLPGGVKSMEKIRQNKNIINFISKFNHEKKVIACICSAAQLLISAKVVKNRKISGYYSMKDDISNAGGIYTDQEAVVDQNIITTAHYKDLGPWMGKALEVYYNQTKS